MKHQDQQPIPAHNNGHYYYTVSAYMDNLQIMDHKPSFTFLHLSNAIKFAKNKTIPCSIYNRDRVLIKDFSKIHEF